MTEQGHPHRWLLPPDVTAGLGRCRVCDAVRMFTPDLMDKPFLLPKAAQRELNMHMAFEAAARSAIWNA